MTALLTEHLPLIASAPNGIKKLRELILQLAVMGKLVPQDPKDEPSDKLLKQILSKKQSLSATGKLKGQQPLPEIESEMKPFPLPCGWRWVRLGDIGDTNIGLTYSPKDIANDGIPVLRSTNIQKGKLDLSDLVRVKAKVSEKVLVSEGDLLICARNGSRALVGKTAIITELKEEMAFGAFMALYRSQFNSFIYYFFNSPLFRQVINEVGTTTINQLTQNNLRSAIMPLPPLAEQHRIVAKVDELMALCDVLEAQQTNAVAAHKQLVKTLLDTLIQSKDQADFSNTWALIKQNFDTLFVTESSIDVLKQTLLQLAVMGKLVPQDPNDEPASELLGKIKNKKSELMDAGKLIKDKPLEQPKANDGPFSIPNSWSWSKIGDYSAFTEYGISEKTFDINDGIPVIKMGDIRDGKVILQNQKKIARGTEVSFLQKYDLLYNRTNSAELVGKTGIFEGPDSQFSFASYLIRIHCLLKFSCPHFLNIVMNTPVFRESQINPHVKQQCGQANVNGTILKNMLIPVPPLAEQHRIVAKVDELMALCDQLKVSLQDGRKLEEQLSDATIEQALSSTPKNASHAQAVKVSAKAAVPA